MTLVCLWRERKREPCTKFITLVCVEREKTLYKIYDICVRRSVCVWRERENLVRERVCVERENLVQNL